MKRLIVLLALIILLSPVSAYMGYGNGTQFNVTANTSTGTQTNYPIKITLSNATGVSSSTAIYTNGTTLPNWYDIAFTDGSDSPLSFWIENNTYTSTQATAWVKIPSISTSGTVTRAYYGNASKTTSDINGAGTFLHFDDFLASSVSSTYWNITGAGISVSNGNALLNATGATSVYIRNLTTTSVNSSVRARLQTRHYNSGTYREYFGSSNYEHEANPPRGDYAVYNGSWRDLGDTTGWSANVWHIQEMSIGDTQSKLNATIDDANLVSMDSPYLGGEYPYQYYFATYASGAGMAVDWACVRPFVYPEPTTSDYMMAGASVPSASFTTNVSSAPPLQNVQFNDTSSGSPTSWNWSFGDGVYNITQNPIHAYSAVGTYLACLNATNAYGSNTSCSNFNVANTSVFVEQDIWMEGQYLQTFIVSDENDIPLENVSCVDSDGDTAYTLVNGTAWLTEPFGSQTMVFNKDGYDQKTIAYVFDSNATHYVTLTTAATTSTPTQSTWWTPHQVQVVILDTFGQPLEGVNVTAAYNQSSMPASWLNDLYGLNSNISTQLVNRSLFLHGETGSDGEIAFPMLGTIKYDIWITSAADGVDNYHVQAYPSDDYLNIYVPTTGSQLPTQGNSTYSYLNQSRVYFTEPDINNVTMCVDYRDTSGSTTSLTVNWTFINNHTVANTTTVAPGTSLNTLCYTLRNVRGTQVWWGYNATRSVA